MAKTFNEFVLECELYPYSKEHLDLMKECLEIDIMNQYIQNQEYLRENRDMLDRDGVENNYMCESITFSDLDHMYDVYIEKSEGFLEKIKNGIKKLIDTIRNFFIKSEKKSEEKEKKKADIIAQLTKIKDKDIKTLKRIVEESKQQAGSFVPLKGKQPGMDGIKNAFGVKLPDDIADWVAAGLTMVATADVQQFAKKNTNGVGPMIIDTVESALKGINYNNPNSYNGAISNLKTNWEYTKKNGMTISGKRDELRKHINTLTELRNKVNESINDFQTDANAKNDAKQDELTQQYNAADKNLTKVSKNRRSTAEDIAAAQKARDDIADEKVNRNVDLANKVNPSNELKNILNTVIGNSLSIMIGLNNYEVAFTQRMVNFLNMIDKNHNYSDKNADSDSNDTIEEES